MKYPTFEFIEKQLRKKGFCIFSSVSPKGRSHSAGIIYGVSPPGTEFAFYILTGNYSRKARNVKSNPNVSVVVPFPHYYLRMVPQWVVQFQGKGEIVPFEDSGAQETFRQKKTT
ncbi:MAG: pyridoxamine 5'-phosphate oxidase family protein, partial [Candidatus Hodarchaeota archaeon]